MTNYTRFSCPNQECNFFNQTNQGNIAHRSWGGKDKKVERLRCTCCAHEFSSNKGSLRERAKITEEQQEIILKCFRWGVPETGTADIAKVNRKTVRHFLEKAATHAEAHHHQNVIGVEEQAAQCDELYAKNQGGSCWVGLAMGASSLLILGVCVGVRNQGMADFLMASVAGRCKKLCLLLTDGWACYWNAFLRCFSELYQPKNKPGRGRPKGKALRLKSAVLYAQVVKRVQKAGKRWRLNSVVVKALSGTLASCERLVGECSAGSTINTSFIERFNASLRNCVGALRRKSRCSVKSSLALNHRVWVFVSLYNWVIVHASLSQGAHLVTPAMAAGLSSQPLSYIDYIRTPIHVKSKECNSEKEILEVMQSEPVVAAAKRYKRGEIEEKTRWTEEELEVAM